MIGHLASLSDQRLIVSFAPYTPALSVLKRIGELFPGPSKVCLGREGDRETRQGRGRTPYMFPGPSKMCLYGSGTQEALHSRTY